MLRKNTYISYSIYGLHYLELINLLIKVIFKESPIFFNIFDRNHNSFECREYEMSLKRNKNFQVFLVISL